MQPASQQPQEKLKIGEVLTRAVDRFRFVLWGVLGAAAVFLLAYFVYNEIDKKLTYDSTLLAEGAETLYQSWALESDATKKATLETDLKDQLARLVSKYPRQYGGQRGLLLRADLAFAGKSWDDAQADYEALAKRFPRSYLAPIALFNAAICLEEKGDKDDAQGLYDKVVKSYADSVIAPRALFNAARIDEEKEAYTEASVRYNDLSTKYPASDWTKLGKNRIIALKVAGKLN